MSLADVKYDCTDMGGTITNLVQIEVSTNDPHIVAYMSLENSSKSGLESERKA